MDPIMLSMLASSVPSIIQGLFGSKKPQVQTTRVRETYSFDRLRKAAEKAGFNPLTVLRATGGGIGSVSRSSSPAPTMRDHLVDGVAAATGAFFGYDRAGAELDGLDILLKRQAVAAGDQLLHAPQWSGGSAMAGGLSDAAAQSFDDATAGISGRDPITGQPIYWPTVKVRNADGSVGDYAATFFQPENVGGKLLYDAAAVASGNSSSNRDHPFWSWYGRPFFSGEGAIFGGGAVAMPAPVTGFGAFPRAGATGAPLAATLVPRKVPGAPYVRPPVYGRSDYADFPH